MVLNRMRANGALNLYSNEPTIRREAHQGLHPKSRATPIAPIRGSDLPMPASAPTATPQNAPSKPASPPPKPRWKRADKIALFAIAVATLAYIDTFRSNSVTTQTSLQALAIAQQTDARSKDTDKTTFQAMVMLIAERVNEIDDVTQVASSQLKGIARTKPGEMIQPNQRSLVFIDQLAGRIPALDLPVDQVVALAKGPQGIAAAVTQCVRMRNQLVADL